MTEAELGPAGLSRAEPGWARSAGALGRQCTPGGT